MLLDIAVEDCTATGPEEARRRRGKGRDMEAKPLTPADRKQCQAEVTPAYSFMTLGPRPRPERCKNRPAVIATEVKPDADGRRGSMSLCRSCLAVFQIQAPGFAKIEDIPAISPSPSDLVKEVYLTTKGTHGDYAEAGIRARDKEIVGFLDDLLKSLETVEGRQFFRERVEWLRDALRNPEGDDP
jgi:hypothetical protein